MKSLTVYNGSLQGGQLFVAQGFLTMRSLNPWCLQITIIKADSGWLQKNAADKNIHIFHLTYEVAAANFSMRRFCPLLLCPFLMKEVTFKH